MLKLMRHIGQLINAAHDFSEALDVMVHSLRDALETQACSIFLLDKKNQEFVLSATEGLNTQAVKEIRIALGQGLVGLVAEREEPVNIDDAALHENFLAVPAAEEDEYKAFMGVPILHRGSVLGVIIVQQAEARRYDESEEALLVTVSTQLAGVIAQAEATGELDQFFGIDRAVEDTLLVGIPGVSGVAVGRGVMIYPLADIDAVPNLQAEDIHAEILAFEVALQAVRDEMILLAKRLAPNLPQEEQELFNAYLRMLDPESVGDDVIKEIKAGNWAQGALRKVVKRYVGRFEAMDNDYMRERSADVMDLGRRILSQLQSAKGRKRDYPDKTILVGEEITAADLAEVPEGKLVGVVSASGSRSSHVAILANALGIPTVMGVTKLSVSQLDQVELIVDGYYGQVYVAPSKQLKSEFQRLAAEETALDKDLELLHNLPAETTDGHAIAMYVNSGLEADVSLALSAGAEGVGLYRTEVHFLKRDRFPSGEEQRVVYRQLLGAFSPRPVVMRTLDIGGDKELPYFPINEDNPFLGWRGIRISLDHPDIFQLQMRAMLRASEGFDNLKIMLPMVSDVVELDKCLHFFNKALEEVRAEGCTVATPEIGVMIEVPSAVYQAKRLAERVDFLSVGSNDLTQYILAVDRNNAHVASLYDWLHPAVLAALQHIVDSAHSVGKQVSICGEMAADPVAVILLLAMGFDSLSMHALSLPRMKWVVRQFSLTQAKQLLQDVQAIDNVDKIRKFLEKELEKMGLGGLIRAGR